MPAPATPADAVAASMNDGKAHLLLAASGSVALVKLRSIISSLDHARAGAEAGATAGAGAAATRPLSIRIVLTKSAARFFNGSAEEQPSLARLASLPNVDGVHLDDDEWTEGWTRGGGILHINLRKWADVMFVVPLSANTLAKLALGMSDNLLTSVVRAWDTTGLVDGKGIKRVFVAPAMNTAMWLHPITAKHIRVLEDEWGVKEDTDESADSSRQRAAAAAAASGGGGGGGHAGWFQVLRPIEKALACGDVGGGGMMEWKDIVKVIEGSLERLP